MSYHTDFSGGFRLDRKASKEIVAKIAALYNDGGSGPGFDGLIPKEIRLPKESSWSPWRVLEDGWCLGMPDEALEWNHNYWYKDWLYVILRGILVPQGYMLNGELEWHGESPDDGGKIVIEDNEVTLLKYIPSSEDDIGEYRGSFEESDSDDSFDATIYNLRYYEAMERFDVIKSPSRISKAGKEMEFACFPSGKVEIFDGVEELGQECFATTNVGMIMIPNTVKVIGKHCFAGCKKLKSIDLAEGVEVIEYGAFKGCESLKEVVLPDSIRNVGEHAFRDCPNLTISISKKTVFAAQSFGDVKPTIRKSSSRKGKSSR